MSAGKIPADRGQLPTLSIACCSCWHFPLPVIDFASPTSEWRREPNQRILCHEFTVAQVAREVRQDELQGMSRILRSAIHRKTAAANSNTIKQITIA
jgi:hypothetical protein